MDSVNDYILKLDKISRYYQSQDSFEQKEVYNSVLNKLRELYRRQPKDFTDQYIVEINKLKIIIQNHGSLKINNCYFYLHKELDEMSVYVITPIGEYSFLNNLLLNSKLENDEIEIKLNNINEIDFIFDKIKKVYLYPAPNQKTVLFKEGYMFYNIYINCKFITTKYNEYSGQYTIYIEGLNNSKYYRTYSHRDVRIDYHAYEEDRIIEMTTDDCIYYFCTLDEYNQGIVLESDFDGGDIYSNKECHINKEEFKKEKEEFKKEIENKLLNIIKKKNKDSLVIELKEYMDKHIGIFPHPGIEIECMYEYICNVIDEIIDFRTDDVLNYNLELIYKLLDADFSHFYSYEENLTKDEYFDEDLSYVDSYLNNIPNDDYI